MDPFVLLLQLLIIVLFIFRMALARKIPGGEALIPFLADTRFRIGLWWKTLLGPLTIMMAFYLVWVQCNILYFHRVPVPAAYESFPGFFAQNLILAPFSEEIIQCVLLSFLWVSAMRVTTDRWKIGLVKVLSLAGVSILLAIGYGFFSPVSLLLPVVLFLIYGAVYFLNDRNLLPAVIAHAAWNVLAVLPVPG